MLYTPGHSLDHICLYDPYNGWWFTSDLFVGGQERALQEGGNIWQIISSLKRMAGLPCVVIFPGSARIREHPKNELDSKIAYLEDMGAKVLELHQKGWDTVDITRSLCGQPMFIELITHGNSPGGTWFFHI